MDLIQYFRERRDIIEKALDKFLPPESEYPEIIHKAIRYSVFAGGKRLRPILVMAGAEAVGGSIHDVLPIACGIEFIHTYSLIHDDLPALDNDDFRRGKPTNHKVFGEDIAILAGDALLTLAFEVISGHYNRSKGFDKVLRIINEIARACGTMGMIGGQVIDLESEGREIDFKTLDYIHNHKTGALIITSIRVGAIYSDATESQLEILTRYAEKIGLLYQIVDDLLDIKGDIKKTGKSVGSDIKNNKSTYPAIYGFEKAQQIACILAGEAKDYASNLGEKGKFFIHFADYLLNRES